MSTVEKIGSGEALAPTDTLQVFFSKSENLRLVRWRIRHKLNEEGSRENVAPGLSYQFENGYLEIDDVQRERTRAFLAEYGHLYGVDPETALSDEGWLRSHPNFNSSDPGGFVEVEQPVPDPSDDVMRIANLMLEEDAEAIVDLWEAERNGLARPAVLDAATKAIDKLASAAGSPSEPQAVPEGHIAPGEVGGPETG